MDFQDEYLQMLDLMYQVAQSLKGKKHPDPRYHDCNRLALKLFFHAATIYWLRQGTKAPVPGPGGAFFHDFASVSVITRTAVETYLTMYELFFEPVQEDEREFRHASWLLAGFVIREGVRPSSTIDGDRVAELQREIEEMRRRIQRTEMFALLTDKRKRRVLKGMRASRSFEKRVRAAGFGPKTIGLIGQRYLSGYVHSDGLSAAQISGAKTAEEQIQHIEPRMSLVIMAMAKMILEYKRLFPSAEACCMAKPAALVAAEKWSEMARRLE